MPGHNLAGNAERIATRISTQELQRRWSAVRAAMADRGIEALVMQSANDWLGGAVKYFTDLPAHNGYPRSVIFPLAGPMTVVEVGPFDATRQFGGADPVHRGVGDIRYSPSFLSIAYTHRYDSEAICDSLRKGGYRTIGLVGAGGMAHGFVAGLQAAFPGAETIVDATDLVDSIKAIKSEEEAGLIRAAARLQDDVFAAVLAAIRPGMRDIDVTALAWREGQIRGSEQGIFLGASAPMGSASPFLGRHMQGRTLAAGDHLSLLIEINGPGGFYTELARTLVLGRASQELLDGFSAVREAQDATLRHMKPGALCRDVAAAHDAFMIGRGLPPELRLYSHGQGYDMVERPLIRRDEPMALREGMCLAVHPGYETESLFAIVCDNYMIGPDGPGSCLHKTQKKVFEI
ncbi:M24 family metallopeptidase [Methylocapsa sp. S129]|uniref:M24 family metallopeptidase n=1 Tax=Methylocapsa sp. S129 TaxID=1641869 RepID=UPI00131BC62F|nr:M24 family metallopeptidase [Methylocapsa sp. S129]